MLKNKLYHIVFETETKAGKRFDVVLLWLILISIIIVMLESVPELGEKFTKVFFIVEWVLTILFTIEYLLRIYISHKPLKYVFSFWGLIDFLSILPTWLSLVYTGYHYLLIVRIFRLLRIFRVLKLVRFNAEAQILIKALRASIYKISIFFVVVLAIVTFLGALMYVVEGGEEGFSSIPQSIYWAIVTVTTVGYGDLVPHTVIGKFISSFAMIIGYAIIAVPTGIVTSSLVNRVQTGESKKCTTCSKENNESAIFCNFFGNQFKELT